MSNGGRAEPIEDIAARKLARVLGYGEPWRAMEQIAEPDGDEYQRDRLPVRSIANEREISGIACIPTWRPDYNIMAALSFANLSAAEQGILLTYAGAFRYWRDVQSAMIERGHSRIAAADGMNRILWARPDASIGERARELHIAKARYGARVAAAERTLRRMLRESAARFLAALNGNQLHPRIGILRDKETDSRRPVNIPRRRRVGKSTATISLRGNPASRIAVSLRPRKPGQVSGIVHDEARDKLTVN
ncbi:MAG TPA: hypothetical protein VFL54_06760 [Gammaproteobacteria bacterium]|nr:hypothetical protein [Gammaproteobacteria bacterium]